MKKTITILVLLVSLISCTTQKEEKNIQKNEKSSKEINFYTSDSIQIFGDLYEYDKDALTILLFHQGGSNGRAEYKTIIPRLIEKNYNVLLIDQRLGGQMFGGYNRTVSNIGYKDFSYNGYTYCDAYPDLESALKFIEKLGFKEKKVLWGSSYSATLAIRLASNEQEKISGVLAFSPATGGSVQQCKADQYFPNLKVPLLILRPPNEMKNENVQKQFNLAKQYNHRTYAAKFGTHGSSMLVSERVDGTIDENWDVVVSFLDEIENN